MRPIMKKVEQNTYNIKQNLKIGGKLFLSFNYLFFNYLRHVLKCPNFSSYNNVYDIYIICRANIRFTPNHCYRGRG